MRFFASFTPFAFGAAAAALLCLPFVGGGCGRTACITLSQAEMAAGSCPNIDAATARFGINDSCPGAVQTVDGQGFRDGNFCCYPVTPTPGDTFCEFAGAGGFASGVGGFGGAGGFGTGGSSGCQLCQDIFNNIPIDPALLCVGTSSNAFNELVACGCNSTSTCTNTCMNSLCFGLSPDDACLSCLFSDQGCTDPIAACNIQ